MTSPPAAHSPSAEREFLGTCLLYPDARDLLAKELEPDDFYVPAHRVAAEAITHLHRAGSAVDPSIVARWVVEHHGRDVLESLGGLAALVGWMGDAPGRATALTNMLTIRDRASRRALKAALLEGLNDVEDLAVPVAEVVDVVQGRVRGVDLPVRAEPSLNVLDFLDRDMDYRWLVPGWLERQDRTLLTGGEKQGKALALDTPIRTDRGWQTMETVKTGDRVYGPDGEPTEVMAVGEILMGRPCYRVTLSDGTSVVADAEHLWETHSLACREADAQERRRGPTRPRGTDQRHKRTARPRLVTTSEIAGSLYARAGHALEHGIPVAAPFRSPDATLPIHPYALGVWLGDGTSRSAQLTCGDPEIVEELGRVGEPVRHLGGLTYTWAEPTKSGPHPQRFQRRLRALGVLGNKHIPRRYLDAGPSQRLALLQGLLDTDGTVTTRPAGSSAMEFSVTNENLARDTYELITGLGIRALYREGDAVLNGRRVGPRYRITFVTDSPVFRLPRKASRVVPLRTHRSLYRQIRSVEPVDPVPVRCIQVDRADGLYCVGTEMVATHNSVLLRQLAVQMAAGVHPWRRRRPEPVTVLIYDLENSERQVWRLLRILIDQVAQTAQGVLGHEPPLVFDPDRLRVEVRSGGLDLLTRADRNLFTGKVAAAKADVVITGPIYKMHSGGVKDEEPAAELVAYLDRLRSEYDVALILEAHSPYSADGGTRRTLRPIGSSIWARWPEFGYGIRKVEGETGVYDFESWIPPRDDNREWPSRIRRSGGKSWPWINHHLPEEEVF